MSDFHKLYKEYGKYNLLYKQLNLPSPSVEYAWRRTKLLLQNEAKGLIFKLLDKKDQVRVADIGCGNGALLICLAQEIKDQKVHFRGFELSQPFVDFANQAAEFKNLTNIEFINLNIEQKNPRDKFDIIITSEVLEHLEKPDQFLQKIHQLLTDQGFLLLSTPNSNNLIKYLFIFLKKWIVSYQEKELRKQLTKSEEKFTLADQEQHLFVFSQSQLRQLLAKTGFIIYQTPRSTSFFGGPFFDNHSLLFGMSIIFDVFLNLLPFPQIGWDNIVFCQKK